MVEPASAPTTSGAPRGVGGFGSGRAPASGGAVLVARAAKAPSGPIATMAAAPQYTNLRRRARCLASLIRASPASSPAGSSTRGGRGGATTGIPASPHSGASINSTMIRVKIDKGDPTDLYEQVAGEIRRAIANGEAQPGERLPPAKDLAAVLGVNTNTVLRALRLLRDEGLLEFRRGRGISVAGTPERGAVVNKARELVELARHHGYGTDELIHIIRGVI